MEKAARSLNRSTQAAAGRNDHKTADWSAVPAAGKDVLGFVSDSPRVVAQRQALKAMFGSRYAGVAQLKAARSLALLNLSSGGAIQRNAFLSNLANAGNQIDYAVISGGGATANQAKLYNAIVDAMGKNLRRQAVLQAIDAAGWSVEFQTYATNQNWTLGTVVSFGQDIRSSHSGGAIDPNLPQAAYEAAPVGGNGMTVSVAPPALNTLAEQANFAWLQDSTTTHTTDPDHPQYRGPTAPHAPPTLGSTVAPGLGGANQRLPSSPGRVASYFELGAHAVHDDNGGDLVSGTRVVYDPFAHRHFVSEHYARQYELINVPAVNAHPAYATVTNRIAQTLGHVNYIAAAAVPATQLSMREVNIYKYVLNGILNGNF